jgi:putative spermidine/putrescine transport system ATP-binding protein
MRDGKLEQLGLPADVYLQPVSAFVADFVGLSNRLPGRIAGDRVEVLGARLPLVSPAAPGRDVIALVRPESIEVVPDAAGTGQVLTTSFLGPTSRVTVTVGDTLVIAQVASGRLAELAAGTPVRVDLRPIPVALDS